MADVSFYQATASTVEKVLPTLLEKIIGSGKRAVVVTSNEKRLKEIDDYLWTSSRFLPHGTAKDPNPNRQPVFITHKEENPSKAEILIVIDGIVPEFAKDFARVVDIYDGNNANDTAHAKQRMDKYADGNKVVHYKQNPKGGWEAAA